ncbi:hypothetical protein AtNW77_Chr1g0020301 [Arabidopsis thaliana]|uniref:DUF4228 domain protein n=4 Tax=Arabidopsis TaxID=3701 RepID=A0A178WMU5_ARATH|nr:DUF4228 domain protein [Arabidopsis thaliana]KAG7646742.1 hypothetical protein ISN45_At01g018500 [Arabidopsis thaliana x Arabidopsis arenosa]KAG7654718.1 hypothetical protein ISN44_As01g018690 [Arabidopsis suecica]AAF25993.1 F15H18.19 [Arabidopsis thaliana]AAF78377.1 T10O22.26 [Arabidopsis thaliana]AAU44385.1 hypothetical protein AT1G18290 [Arabidopsis thaliana]|eukprot:NP_173265.1 DUF4228 domain protein [Arabidopsis thaliana]
MGNTSSCAPLIISTNSSSGVVKILAPFTGTLEVFSKPIKTSDIVSRHSGHFITDSTLLQISHRVTAVSPDEYLRPRRHLYLLLPTDMLFSVLTQEELSLISNKAAETLNKSRYNHLKRIFPVCIFPMTGDRRRNPSSVNEDRAHDGVEIRETLDEKVLYESKHGSWRPKLETIVES